MVRHFARKVRRLVAVACAVGVGFGGAPALAAGQVSVSRRDGSGMIEFAYAQRQEQLRRGGFFQAADMEGRAEEIKSMMLAFKKPQREGPERMARMLVRLELLAAKTHSERRSLIRRLPVEVVTSAAADGRAGVTKSYLVGGKVRLQTYVPAASHGVSSGPSGDALPSDDSAREECWEGEEEPCATEEEMDEAGILIAWAVEDAAYQHAQVEALNAEYAAYCSQNPWACEAPADEVSSSGPSACSEFAGCGDHAYKATVAAVAFVGSSALAVDDYLSVRAAGKKWSVLRWVGRTASVVAATAAAGYFIGSYIDCRALMNQMPESGSLGPYWYEPVSKH